MAFPAVYLVHANYIIPTETLITYQLQHTTTFYWFEERGKDEVWSWCGRNLFRHFSPCICLHKYELLPVLLRTVVHIHPRPCEHTEENRLHWPSYDPSRRFGSSDQGHHGRTEILDTVCFCNSGNWKVKIRQILDRSYSFVKNQDRKFCLFGTVL